MIDQDRIAALNFIEKIAESEKNKGFGYFSSECISGEEKIRTLYFLKRVLRRMESDFPQEQQNEILKIDENLECKVSPYAIIFITSHFIIDQVKVLRHIADIYERNGRCADAKILRSFIVEKKENTYQWKLAELQNDYQGKKVAFIIPSTGKGREEETEKYIEHLKLPQGIETEIHVINGAASMTQAYNYGMKITDAEYKVYLHEDVYIRNPYFIYDFLHIFEQSEKIGMIGVMGSRMIPKNEIWWESGKTVGKTLEDKTVLVKETRGVEEIMGYEKVMAIDGQIMVTCHDIPWREELFEGWHYYDVSQSIEFLKRGYEVVVPEQQVPWCLHDCGIGLNSGFEESRKRFCQNYSEYLEMGLPL